MASASPRRKEFFDLLGLAVEIVPSRIDEMDAVGAPARVALQTARRKVEEVRASMEKGFTGWLIGADTVVALRGEMFGKPKDREDAARMLRKLSGRTHQVFTAFRVESSRGDSVEDTVDTDVTFTQLTEADIQGYVATGEADDKAGAYAIQGRGGVFVRRISGSYSNVVGLPLHEVISALRSLGAVS